MGPGERPHGGGRLRTSQGTDLCSSRNSFLRQSLGPTAATITPAPTDLDLDVQARQSAAYKALHRRIIDAGLYKCPHPYRLRTRIYSVPPFLASLAPMPTINSWFITSAFFLGLMWHQLMFFAHDLGHMGLTRRLDVRQARVYIYRRLDRRP